MYALSIRQPDASLVAHGFRYIDIRMYRPPSDMEGRRIAIHAASGTVTQTQVAKLAANPLPRCFGISPKRILVMKNFLATAWHARLHNEAEFSLLMPRGAIVATAVLRQAIRLPSGTWAWTFSEVRRILEPIPHRGHSRSWNLTAAIPLRAGTVDQGSCPAMLLRKQEQVLTRMLRSNETSAAS